MNELIVTACADRRTWLFVAAGTLIAGLMFVMPGVDHYIALRGDRSDLIERKLAADRTVQQVKVYEAQLSGQQVELDKLKGKTLAEADVADFRNILVKLVRDSGCQLRRLNISSPQARDWRMGDSPFDPAANDKPLTPFRLETRVVSLSLNGSLPRVRELLDKVQANELFAYAKTIDMRPESQNPRQVDLNIELWFFALQRRDAA
jgi:hypothetical protein